METVLLVQTGSTDCPDGACRSQRIRPSRPGKQVARFNQPSRRFAGKSARASIARRAYRFALRSGAAAGPGIFPPGSKAIGSAVPLGMPFANRLCPDENLLRQNVAI